MVLITRPPNTCKRCKRSALVVARAVLAPSSVEITSQLSIMKKIVLINDITKVEHLRSSEPTNFYTATKLGKLDYTDFILRYRSLLLSPMCKTADTKT